MADGSRLGEEGGSTKRWEQIQQREREGERGRAREVMAKSPGPPKTTADFALAVAEQAPARTRDGALVRADGEPNKS